MRSFFSSASFTASESVSTGGPCADTPIEPANIVVAANTDIFIMIHPSTRRSS